MSDNNGRFYDDKPLDEKDFYPPADNRTIQSLIEDIGEGNNFIEYAEYIYDLYESEGYYEN